MRMNKIIIFLISMFKKILKKIKMIKLNQLTFMINKTGTHNQNQKMKQINNK